MSQEYKWVPGWIEGLSLKPFSLNFMLEPRLAEKTSGIKLLIRSLLGRAEPERILYVSCEIFLDYTLLAKALTSYLEGAGMRRLIYFSTRPRRSGSGGRLLSRL